ncbi:MAG TPA: hypothetical protein VNA04_03530 [Thermoanaerobaculia bacterium]|nr:hypothetical protein [Thermoanaerobaculia bacterium]
MRRRLALTLFVLIAAASADLSLLRTATIDRSRTALALRSEPWPGYEAFLAGVRHRTHAGDSIALLVPSRGWEQGYSYGYFRASYVLAGREVLPVIGPGDQQFPGRVDRAAYVAVWRGRIEAPQRPVVWRGSGGELLGPP